MTQDSREKRQFNFELSALQIGWKCTFSVRFHMCCAQSYCDAIILLHRCLQCNHHLMSNIDVYKTSLIPTTHLF